MLILALMSKAVTGKGAGSIVAAGAGAMAAKRL